MLGMLAPLLQKNGLDPNLLLAMNNRGNGGFGGEGGWFMWVIFLFFLFPRMDVVDSGEETARTVD